MKLIQTVLVFALAFVSLNVNSQDALFTLKAESLSSKTIDSIQNLLLIELRQTEFYYFKKINTAPNPEYNNKPLYGRLENPISASINENKLTLTFKKNEIRILQLDTIIKENSKTLVLKYSYGWGLTKQGYFWSGLYFNNYTIKHLQNQYLHEIKLKEINKQKENYNNEINKFKSLVIQQKSSNSTDQITEDQRKFIVQANAQNEAKNYFVALKLYENAIGINPFTYPQAYYNMALIASQIKNYHYAMFNMKKYLILSPDASDARAAQDKIYEWELLIEK